ncbi:Mur ligase family protein [Microvirga soli]|uniref:Mur ligase family protein n=1 Tax=Microvirga soli TaxID=1854496 RepID=UPI00191D6A69|nr:Mur ligase family protein [Microvirga soli]
MKDQFLGLYEALRPLEKQALEQTAGHFGRKPKVVVFLSASNKAARATVAVGLGNSFDSAWKNALTKLKRITPYGEGEWRWLKADLVTHIRAWKPTELAAHLATVRRNYFRLGIAFDPDFGHALLEQELNGIAAISEDEKTGHLGLNENRIRNYFKRERGLSAMPKDLAQRDAWFTFDTEGAFSDATDRDGTVHRLQSGGNVNGIRLAPNLQAETLQLIHSAGTYLASEIRDDGSFNYGWFPTYGKAIGTYNILRHCSTLYSMLEAWEATSDEAIAVSVPRGIEYVLREALQRREEGNVPHAYVVDHANGSEIKLGAQAALILTIAKYTTLSGSPRFLDDARAVANGIIGRLMDSASGRYIHVLNAPDLSIKEMFRIIYYDGEATFALLRLYALDPDPRWLNAACRAFDHFLSADYWQHHDHWLSYCTDEITRYLPEDRYFEFGLKNAFGNLRFIHDRETAFPTFLELLTAAARMLETIRAQDKQYLLEHYDIDQLYRTIKHRAEYQRASHFYPEMAMYFARPKSIAGSFYIRHHSFRVRIDDVEHFISGYCQYLRLNAGRPQSSAAELLQAEPEGAVRKLSLSSEALSSGPVSGGVTSKLGWTADELVQHLNGRWLTSPPAGWSATDLAISSKDITGDPNTLFIAIDENTWYAGSGNTGVYADWSDTHDLLLKVNKRCCGAIVQRPLNGLPADFPQLLVPNSYEAILQLGRVARGRMHGRIIAVTGTVGKSTTKAMLDLVLRRRGNVIATKSNHNTRTGVPLTLARCVTDPEFCVLEVAQSALWMRKGGICLTARPHIGIITEIGLSQGDKLPDVQRVASIKARICQGIEPGGVGLLNREMAEYDRVHDEVEHYGATPLSFGFSEDAEIRVLEWQPDSSGSLVQASIRGIKVRYRVPVAGRAMVTNSLAVLGAASVLGEDVEAAARAIETFTPNEGVLVQRTIELSGRPLHIIDDSHNAEVLSMKAAFEVAALHPKHNGARRIALLGQIMLLGPQASELHRSLAQPLLAAEFDKVFTHGEEMLHLHEALPESVRAGHFATAQDLADAAAACVTGGDIVLIKGDRRATDFGKVPGLLSSRLKEARNGLNRTIRSIHADVPKPYVLPETAALASEALAGKDPEPSRTAAETRVVSNISQVTWTAAQIEAAIGGRWLTPPPDGWSVQSVVRGSKHIDMLPGPTLYVASTRENLLHHESSTASGANWDTHLGLPALASRLAGAIVARPVAGLPSDFPVLQVEDPIGALITLGYAARERYKGKVVAVTGSAGKSSTVAMLRHILPPEAGVHATIDNYNSRVGVPVMLASLAEDVGVCILEIAQSALWINSGPVTLRARPHVAIITEIALTQTDQVKSVEDVARFKSRIFRGLEGEAAAIFNEDLPCGDIIQQAAQSYAKKMVLTGTSATADVCLLSVDSSDAGSYVRARVFGEDVTFTINVLGSGQVRNALNALAAVVQLGFDAKAAAARFPTYHPGLARMERRTLDTPRGTITVIDDSWNASVIAMVNAFESMRTYSVESPGRKIAALGRIVHLGDMAQELHRSLKEPLLAAGFDHVVTHGDAMRFLREVLPQDLLGPHFSSAEPCVAYLLDVCRNNDVILMKGSRRDSDFGKVGPMLIERLVRGEEQVDANKAGANAKAVHVQPEGLLVGDARSESPHDAARKPQEAVATPISPQAVERGNPSLKAATKSDENVSGTQQVASVAIDLMSGEVLAGKPEQIAVESAGVNQLLLLMLCFEKLNGNDVQLQQQVAVSDVAAGQREPEIGLQARQKLSVAELIEAIVVCNARDAAFALAEHIYGTASQCLMEMRSLAAKLGLAHTNLQSITGQAGQEQQTTLSDIASVACALFGSHLKYRRWFSQSVVTINGSVRFSESNLIASGAVSHGYFFRSDAQHGIALTNIAGRDIVLCVVNAHDAFHRDYILHALVASAQRALRLVPPVPKPLAQRPVSLVSRSGEYRINLIGDTYFGEYYTGIRQRKGIQDALTRHGYDHSFKKLEPLIASGDYNIANFEAVLTRKSLPSFISTKPYLLAGDPVQSTGALRRRGFHAVSLGNNHAFDYGTPGLIDTLESFSRAGIRTFGAGQNALEAEEPLEVHCGDRRVVFFTGYQYRKYMEEDFAFYAMAQRPGVACLSGGLVKQLHETRIQDPNALLVILPHWGFDFEWRSKMQRKYAEQFASAGADLIIGHGAHMMQEVEQVSDCWVVYGIGNGVFNSNGEYDRRGLAPFSLFAQIVISSLKTEVRLYPLYCDNLKTDWQPRLVTEVEFKKVIGILRERGARIGGAARNEISVDEDTIGKYLAFDVLGERSEVPASVHR